MTFADMPTLKVEIETPSQAAANNIITFDGTTQFNGTRHFAAGPSDVFVNRAQYVRGLQIQRGSSSPSDVLFHTNLGTTSCVFDNRTRVFDPASSADIRPNLAMRVTATWAATDYQIYNGFVTRWELGYDVSGRDATAVMTAGDGQQFFAAKNLTSSFPAWQLTGARVQAIAEQVGWPEALIDVDDGQSRMNALTQTESAWPAMVEAADSELGDLFIDMRGMLRFRDRQDLISQTTSTVSNGTFGDGGGAELPIHDVTFSYDDERIRNSIEVTYNDNNGVAIARDPRSIALYGERSFQIQASLASSRVAQNLANYLLRLYKDPLVRVDQVVLTPRKSPGTVWPFALGREIGDMITVKVTPPGGGSRITKTALIRGIRHDVTADDWMTTWTLQTPIIDPSLFAVFDGTTQFNGTKLFWF